MVQHHILRTIKWCIILQYTSDHGIQRTITLEPLRPQAGGRATEMSDYWGDEDWSRLMAEQDSPAARSARV